MEQCTEYDENMPVSMVVYVLLVIGKEIHTRGIGNTFGNDEDDSQWGNKAAYWFGKKYDCPTEYDIENER